MLFLCLAYLVIEDIRYLQGKGTCCIRISEDIKVMIQLSSTGFCGSF